MYLMKDITRDGNPVLRKRAAKVSFPLSDEDQKLAKDMMKYLEVSQDPELCEKYKLRRSGSCHVQCRQCAQLQFLRLLVAG